MNKLYTRLAAFFIITAATAACTKEQPVRPEPKDESKFTELNAVQPTVKSHFGPKQSGSIPVCWDATDAICVFSQGGGSEKAEFTTTAEDISDDGQSAKFKGEANAEGPFCAAYPYSLVTSGSSSQIVFSVPQKQTYLAGSFGNGANLAAACWESGNTATFKNLCGTIRIPLKGNKSVGSIVLKDNNPDASLWGTCTAVCDISHNDFSDISFKNGDAEIKLVCNPAVQLKSDTDTDFFIVVPAGAFSTGFKMTIFDESGTAVNTLATDKDFTIQRSTVRVATDLNVDSPFTYGGEGTAAKPYIIANASDLRAMSSLINSDNAIYGAAYYKQVNDVDMTGVSYSSAGTSSSTFKGNYDGGDKAISNLKITAAAGNNGLFGYISGATVENVTLSNVALNSTPGNSGTIAGYCNDGATVRNCKVSASGLTINKKGCGGVVGYINGNSTVEGCSFEGTIDITIGGKAELSECAGIVGYTKLGHIRNCTFAGRITTDGERIAGITSALFGAGSTIENCTVTKDAVIYCKGDLECGGISGIVADGATVDGCRVDGKVLNEVQRAGGIAGTFRKGTIRNCVIGPDAVISAIDTQAGGIAGAAYWTDNVTSLNVENCLVCGKVQGKARVGGIVGYYTHGNKSGDALNIINCGFDGGTLIATQNITDGSDFIADMGGMIGTCACSTYDETINILNCWCSPVMMRLRPNQVPYGSEAIDHTTSPRVGGLIGGQTGGSSHITVAGCYCDMAKFQIDFGGKEWPDTPTKHYGGLYGKCSTNIIYDHNFCTMSIQPGPGWASISQKTGSEQIGNIEVTDGTLLGRLNAFKSAYAGSYTLKNWVRGPEGHPVLEGFDVPLSGKKRAPLRISVIGDSISTFIGWLPDGYHRYYPASASSSLAGGMSLTKVSQTYWWRLAYNYMSNAVIDKNIAWSGSLVSALKKKHFDAAEGSTSHHYFSRSFVERFIQQDGMGNPDIIIIKGGTNDSGKSAWTPASGDTQHKDFTKGTYSGDKYQLFIVNNSIDQVLYRKDLPKKEALDYDIAQGNKATTYEAAKNLKDDTFCESYVKLIRMCQTKYPKVKIVCIVSDSIFDGYAATASYVAEKMGCKTVDLYRINGVKTYKNNLLMPKVDATDLSKNGNGCHPDPRGMEFVANKIYTELGAWLEGDPYSDGDTGASNDKFGIGQGEW